jgi:gas vesicle protein
MSTDPVQIRREIEQTRENLSQDVDALAYKVSPSRIVDDRKQRAKGALRKVKDSVMGTASDLHGVGGHATSSVSDRASSAAHRASAAVSDLGDSVSHAPQKLQRKAEGNPLAAGLIAFGVGWLVSSLIPASEREQQAAQQLREKVGEHGDEIRQKAGELVQEAREQLREPAQHAAESVKETARDAAQTVKEDGRSAARDVTGHARDTVRS